jgi:hypothetical protein
VRDREVVREGVEPDRGVHQAVTGLASGDVTRFVAPGWTASGRRRYSGVSASDGAPASSRSAGQRHERGPRRVDGAVVDGQAGERVAVQHGPGADQPCARAPQPLREVGGPLDRRSLDPSGRVVAGPVDLLAPRVRDDHPLALPDGVQGADAVRRDAQRVAHRRGGHEPDAQTGERTWTEADDHRGELGGRAPVEDRPHPEGEQLAVAPGVDDDVLGEHLAALRLDADEGRRDGRRAGVEGEDEHRTSVGRITAPDGSTRDLRRLLQG